VDFSRQLERIYRELNNIQLVCDDGRMPQELTDDLMRHQKAIKAEVDTIAKAVDYIDDEEDDDEPGEPGGQ
jgi:hypothetical protein